MTFQQASRGKEACFSIPGLMEQEHPDVDTLKTSLFVLLTILLDPCSDIELAMPASDSSERTAIATNPEAEARHEMATEQSQAYQKDVRPTEKSTGKQLLQGFVLITAILWICLPIFWGSNWLLVRFLNRLTITTVNFEGANGLVGPVLTQLAEQVSHLSDLGDRWAIYICCTDEQRANGSASRHRY